MDNGCMFNACENGRPLKSQGVAAMNACAVKSTVQEDIDGCTWTSSISLPSPPPRTSEFATDMIGTLGLPHLPMDM